MRFIVIICAVLIGAAALLDGLIVADLLIQERSAISVLRYLLDGPDLLQWVGDAVDHLVSGTPLKFALEWPAGTFFGVRAVILTGLAALLFAVAKGLNRFEGVKA